jgi:uncharacterized membrane protein YccC
MAVREFGVSPVPFARTLILQSPGGSNLGRREGSCHMKLIRKLSPWSLLYSITMALACLVSFWIMTHLLNPIVAKDDDVLGGMWAAVAAAFVFREARFNSIAAGVSRLVATFVSIVLCLAYLHVAPPSAVGMAILLAIGALIMILLDRREELITTGITTIVVMAVAMLSPDPRNQPLLRFVDTLVGVGVGVLCSFVVTVVFARLSGNAAQQSQ